MTPLQKSALLSIATFGLFIPNGMFFYYLIVQFQSLTDVVDDLLATGGTVKGTIELIERLKGDIVGLAFLVELDFLHGRERLGGRRVTSVIRY